MIYHRCLQISCMMMKWSTNSCCISTTIKDINNTLITSLTHDKMKQWTVKVMPTRECQQHRIYYKYRRKKGEAILTHIGTYLSFSWKVSSFVSTPLVKKFTCSCLWKKENIKILDDFDLFHWVYVVVIYCSIFLCFIFL